MKYELNQLYNEDCLVAMKDMPDNYFDLAIVDPPYGGGGDEHWGEKVQGRFGNKGGRFDRYMSEKGVHFHGRGRSAKYVPDIKCSRTGGGWAKKLDRDNSIRSWDYAPSQEYFDELRRVSKNQIIWGGNYFDLPPTRCFVVWRKLSISEQFSMAMCEYAWTSFNANAKWFECSPQGGKDKRFHPTQKPIRLYEWLLDMYATKGDKILDTHCGSASSLVVCHNLGYEYMGFEIDKRYYDLASERLALAKQQMCMFELGEIE